MSFGTLYFIVYRRLKFVHWIRFITKAVRMLQSFYILDLMSFQFLSSAAATEAIKHKVDEQ